MLFAERQILAEIIGVLFQMLVNFNVISFVDKLNMLIQSVI